MTKYRPKIIESAFVDFISERIIPFASPVSSKVKLVDKQWLSKDLVALTLRPNKHWHKLLKHSLPTQSSSTANFSWQSGQHITLGVTLDGICHHRSYSLVGSPAVSALKSLSSQDDTPLDTLTIAIKPQGLISNHLAYDANIGDVFDCSVPQGEFTLVKKTAAEKTTEPSINHAINKDTPLGFVASGSGITPMPGLIADALRTGSPDRPVTLLYYYSYAKNGIDELSTTAPVFHDFWQRLQSKYDNFHAYFVNTLDADSYVANSRHINKDVLTAVGLADSNCFIFACGSSSLLAGVRDAMQALQTQDASEETTPKPNNLAIESFGLDVTVSYADPSVSGAVSEESSTAEFTTHNIWLRQRGRKFTVSLPGEPGFAPSHSILQQAERHNMQMTHGCRQGVCNMCRCDKISGVVKDISTGKLSREGQESIKICVSVPMTDVILDT